MTKIVRYEGDIKITIPDDKIKEILPGYKGSMDSSANEESLFYQIAHNVVFCGNTSFVEGVGEESEDFVIEEFGKPDLDILD